MPELPEVEAARRLLEFGCVGKRIEKAAVADDDKVFDGASPADVRRVLEGRRIVGVHRKGKYLWLQLDNDEGPWPLLHFGMTGGIVVQRMGASKYKRIHLESDPDDWPPRFTKLEMDLEGGAKVAFVDARRFARVKLQINPPSQEPVSKLGFDVLNELPSLELFTTALRTRVARAPGLKIKALLLDQEFCSGIGNWIGDEVLYQSRIHPEQPAASLDDASLEVLFGAIYSVIKLAVEVEADSERFPRDWLFHYRWTNKKPGSINGHTIEFVTVGSRTSAFVPAVQKLAESNGKASRSGHKESRSTSKIEGAAGKTSAEPGRGSRRKASDDANMNIEEEDDGDEGCGNNSVQPDAKRARAAAQRSGLAAVTRRGRKAAEAASRADGEAMLGDEEYGASDNTDRAADADDSTTTTADDGDKGSLKVVVLKKKTRSKKQGTNKQPPQRPKSATGTKASSSKSKHTAAVKTAGSLTKKKLAPRGRKATA